MPLLDIRGLQVEFPTPDGLVRAVGGIDLAISAGETLGLVGESGSGKSVTALSILQLLDPPGRVVAGEVLLGGVDLLKLAERKMLSVRGKRIGMIFQEPNTSLNPTVTIGSQLMEVVRVEDFDAWRSSFVRGFVRQIRRRPGTRRSYKRDSLSVGESLLRSVYVPDARQALVRFPFMFSGGMLQRAMIAVALGAGPELLIADEPTTALDVTIQAQILHILRERKKADGLTLLLITHDLGMVAEMCDRVAVMYAGRIAETAPVIELFDEPLHPYTRGLLASMPSVIRPRRTLPTIEGAVPELIGLFGSSCFFAPRCPLATEICRTEAPLTVAVRSGHTVACHVYSHDAMRPLLPQLRMLWNTAPGTVRAVGASAAEPVRPQRPDDAAASTILEAIGLSKHFKVRGGGPATLRAVDGVSFDVRSGETLALVGESGCGKTTTGELILMLQRPTAGDVRFDGRSIFRSSPREQRRIRRLMQVVFQSPRSSLDPRMRVKDILHEPAAGVARRDGAVVTKPRELLTMVGLQSRFMDLYPHQLSGGQAQRVAIARALAVRPRFLVLDEPASALDVSVQSQILNLLNNLQTEFGLTYLFISHDLRVVRNIADRTAVMYLGKVVEIGPTEQMYRRPMHPYTEALIASIPTAHPALRRERAILPGEVPSSASIPSGCRFRTRCPVADTVCREVTPEFREIAPGHWVACHFAPNATARAETPPLSGGLVASDARGA
jgi:peptide/nickel transport system ATP-binding protein